MSYYRQFPIDVRVAMFISRNISWFSRVCWALTIIVPLAVVARDLGLGQ